MHTLVKTACAIENLSLATVYGAGIFAKAALRPAVITTLQDEKERGRLLACAFTNYNKINVPAHIAFLGTHLIERNFIMKLHVDEKTQKLLAVKDVLIAGAFLTGVANVAVFNQLKRDYPDGVPVRADDKPSNDPKLERYRRYFRVMGRLHLALVGGSIAIGSAIGAGILRSQKRNLLSRLMGQK